MTKLLRGVRVLDLTNVLAGPFACHQLAHFGAEVIKVEEPTRGDLARQLGADPELNRAGMGVSFLAQNAGKSSVTMNLKHAEGKALFLRLLETADVVVENFRPGVMDRLGLGYETLRKHKPDLVYCAISGFGQTSPWKGRPAYDQIIQGASGVMSVTGSEESGPLRAGFPIADTVGGLTAAMAVCAALNARPRGSFIDVSMLESVMTTMGWAVSNFLTAGVIPRRVGNENVTSAPSGAFQTSDGLINIAANKDEQWEALTDVLGRPDLRDQPSFKTREDRKANRATLKAELEDLLGTQTTSHWVKALNKRGVPAGPVLTLTEALTDSEAVADDFITEFKGAKGVDRDVRVVTSGARINGMRPKVDTPPPALGAETETLLSSLGLSSDEISKLRHEGAI